MEDGMKYEWAIKGIILSAVIMCMQAAGWFPYCPWQFTIIECMLIAYLMDRWFPIKNKEDDK
jgi:hypothetical protein